MSAITELPAELPPLPPVPEGYDRWQLKGWGGLKGEQSTPWAATTVDCPWSLYDLRDPANGYRACYYILAVKDPAPALDALADANEIGDCALASQVGGDHYKHYEIQPVEFITKNKIGFCEGNAIKYLCRHQDKNGAQDLRKAIHYIELLLQMEYPGK